MIKSFQNDAITSPKVWRTVSPLKMDTWNFRSFPSWGQVTLQGAPWASSRSLGFTTSNAWYQKVVIGKAWPVWSVKLDDLWPTYPIIETYLSNCLNHRIQIWIILLICCKFIFRIRYSMQSDKVVMELDTNKKPWPLGGDNWSRKKHHHVSCLFNQVLVKSFLRDSRHPSSPLQPKSQPNNPIPLHASSWGFLLNLPKATFF